VGGTGKVVCHPWLSHKTASGPSNWGLSLADVRYYDESQLSLAKIPKLPEILSTNVKQWAQRCSMPGGQFIITDPCSLTGYCLSVGMFNPEAMCSGVNPDGLSACNHARVRLFLGGPADYQYQLHGKYSGWNPVWSYAIVSSKVVLCEHRTCTVRKQGQCIVFTEIDASMSYLEHSGNSHWELQAQHLREGKFISCEDKAIREHLRKRQDQVEKWQKTPCSAQGLQENAKVVCELNKMVHKKYPTLEQAKAWRAKLEEVLVVT